MVKNALFLFLFACLVLFMFLPSFTQMQELRDKNTFYEAEAKRLKEEKAVLLEEQRRLEEDPAYLEKVAREKMGLVREGEVVFRLTPAPEEKK